jgi:thioredoxin-like negative regulator of GroEL
MMRGEGLRPELPRRRDMESSGESKNPNLEDLLRLGVRTAKAGNRDGARVIFQQVLDTDKRNEIAWLWMASLADNNIDRRRYLETVLKINPNNATANKQLKAMNQAIKRSEGASVRTGVILLAILILALAVVGAVVLVIVRIR